MDDSIGVMVEGRQEEGCSFGVHTTAAEIHEPARKVGVNTSPDAWRDIDALWAYREAFCSAIREYNARGESARTWTVQS